MTPLEDSILCRAAVQVAPTATGEMMYIPGGLQTITPIGGGLGQPITVRVDASGAAALNRQHAAIIARHKRPMFDFNHEGGAASFWPAEYFWKDTPEPGIYCRGEWTASGKTAVEGKDFRQFSPVFHVSKKLGATPQNPAAIVCREWAKANMGGLVNDPAFHTILPLWAKNAPGAHPDQPNQIEDMTPEELAALQAKNRELQKELDALKARDAALKAKNETDAALASELKAKEAELKLGQSEERNAALVAKNADQEKAITARNKSDAEAAVDRAVKRNAIPVKDDKTQAALVAKATDDPAFIGVIDALAGQQLSGRITPAAPAAQIQMGQIGGKDALQAYSAIVAKNAAIHDVRDPQKGKLANEAAAIYARELKGREDDWMNCPLEEAIKAADVTSAAVGTLAGTLVLQRNLPLLKFNYPMLRTMFTDFSDAVGLWQQTELTRIPITPAVTEYDATLDANGRPKGFVVVTPAQTVDVPITLSKHVGIPMIFGVQTLASTVRNLFAEQSAGAINALGGYFVDMATALMTAANFNAYKQITDAACGTTSGSTAMTLATTAGVYPGQEISGTGIPTGTHIASVTDGTNAVMTIAATATATVTATLSGGKVPTLYPTYVKALADFNFASLGEIGVAFDNNRVPYEGRYAMLNASYYARLTQDPTVNNFFAAMNSKEIISKGALPELNNFTPQKAPFFPTTSSRVGFAYHAAAMALKARLPQDFTTAVGAMVPGSVTTVTDPDTGLSVLNVQRVDLVGSYAESRIEAMLGANVGDRRAGLVLTSA